MDFLSFAAKNMYSLSIKTSDVKEMLLRENFTLINRLIELNSLLIMSEDSMTNEQRFEANMIKARMEKKERGSKTKKGPNENDARSLEIHQQETEKGATTQRVSINEPERLLQAEEPRTQ